MNKPAARTGSLLFILLFASIAWAINVGNCPAEEQHSKPRPTPGPTHPRPMPGGPTHVAADLREKINAMKLKEGSNLLHTNNGAKLFAVVHDRQITDYKAIDANGKEIPIRITRRDTKGKDGGKEQHCFACYWTNSYPGPPYMQCYEVECKTVPKK